MISSHMYAVTRWGTTDDDTIIVFCKTGKGSRFYAEAPTASSWKTGWEHCSAAFTFSSCFHTYFFPGKFPVDFRNLYTSYSTINKPFHDIYVVIRKQLHLKPNSNGKANYSTSDTRLLSFNFWPLRTSWSRLPCLPSLPWFSSVLQWFRLCSTWIGVAFSAFTFVFFLLICFFQIEITCECRLLLTKL